MNSSQDQRVNLKSYQKPALTEFGKVEQLTRGSGGTRLDKAGTRRVGGQ